MLKLYKPQQVLVFAFLITFVVGAFTSVSAQWEGWAYRRTIAVSNPSIAELTNFQVKIDLSNLTPAFNFANTNSDGSDLRITSDDQVTEIPFWIEEWNAVGNTATIWVKVPSIPTTGTTIYLYYGNTTATSASNGTNTFNFFDDFSNNSVSGQNWIRRLEYSGGNWGPSYVVHDWKYSSEMQHGALEYSLRRQEEGWAIESLDAEIEQEFNYINSQLSPGGTVLSDPGGFLTAEPRYCYGLILSNLALGYRYFATTNSTLATRCYNDMLKVFNYLRVTYPTTGSLSDAGGSGFLLMGYGDAWKAFTAYGNVTSAAQALTLVQNYAATFLANQPGGNWTGTNGVQEHLKRDFGVLTAFDVTGDTTYLGAVRNNIVYILNTFWISSNGGLEWYSNPASSDHFYECHQMWFMIAVRMLRTRSNGLYDYAAYSQQAWYFLTDNNYTNIDMYLHNYYNHAAFFSYRQITSGGVIQVDPWKGSYEIGTALWGMSLNYGWLSNYQSSHSDTLYDYLDMMVKQIKNSPTNRGYVSPGTVTPNTSLWTTTGSPTVSIIQHNGNPVASFTGVGSHNNYIKSIQNFDNFILEMKTLMTVDLNNNCTPEIGFRVTNDNNRYITMLRGEAINDLFIRRYQGGVVTNPATYPTYNYAANTYYKYKIVANGTTLEQHLNDVLARTWNDAGSTITTGGISLTNYGGSPTNPVYYDDVRIRSYASVEPTAAVSAEEANPLPVELNSFSVSVIGTKVNLSWMTETEVNNYGFEIHRVAENDKNGWTNIGFVQGNGNSNSPKYYSFEDNNLTAGKYSYRLMQIDTDGQFEYSKVIEINLDAPMKYELSQNYPNPFNPVTTIQFSMPEAGEVKLVVYNVLGEQVAVLVNENKEAGVHTINFNATELNSGIYIYKLTTGNFSAVKKLMVIK